MQRTYLLPFTQLSTTSVVGTEQIHHTIDDQQLVRAIIHESDDVMQIRSSLIL